MNRVLVYQDYIHNTGQLFASLMREFGSMSVGYCDASDIVAGCLDSSVRLFIMPGGADLYYCEKLNGAGNAAIRRFVEAGGIYLGICAGAYYACRRIEWAKGDHAHSIVGKRELGFFPGTAIGPHDAYMEDHDINKSWQGLSHLLIDGKIITELYSGGPSFLPDDPAHDLDIIARYGDLAGQPIAIFKVCVGKGEAVFCGPHIESSPDDLERASYSHLNASADWNRKIIKNFKKEWLPDSTAWKTVMKCICHRMNKIEHIPA